MAAKPGVPARARNVAADLAVSSPRRSCAPRRVACRTDRDCQATGSGSVPTRAVWCSVKEEAGPPRCLGPNATRAGGAEHGLGPGIPRSAWISTQIFPADPGRAGTVGSRPAARVICGFANREIDPGSGTLAAPSSTARLVAPASADSARLREQHPTAGRAPTVLRDSARLGFAAGTLDEGFPGARWVHAAPGVSRAEHTDGDHPAR